MVSHLSLTPGPWGQLPCPLHLLPTPPGTSGCGLGSSPQAAQLHTELQNQVQRARGPGTHCCGLSSAPSLPLGWAGLPCGPGSSAAPSRVPLGSPCCASQTPAFCTRRPWPSGQLPACPLRWPSRLDSGSRQGAGRWAGCGSAGCPQPLAVWVEPLHPRVWQQWKGHTSPSPWPGALARLLPGSVVPGGLWHEAVPQPLGV